LVHEERLPVVDDGYYELQIIEVPAIFRKLDAGVSKIVINYQKLLQQN